MTDCERTRPIGYDDDDDDYDGGFDSMMPSIYGMPHCSKNNI